MHLYFVKIIASLTLQPGLVTADHAVQQMPVMMKRARLTGSMIGGMPETQECIVIDRISGIRPDIWPRYPSSGLMYGLDIRTQA